MAGRHCSAVVWFGWAVQWLPGHGVFLARVATTGLLIFGVVSDVRPESQPAIR